MGKVHWIGTDGGYGIEDSNAVPDTEAMRKFVGGYLEFVHVFHNGSMHYMIVNDEGRLKGLPVNKPATEIYFAASRARGVEPTDPEQSKADADNWARSKGIDPKAVIHLDPRPDEPPGIHGPAILLENIKVE